MSDCERLAVKPSKKNVEEHFDEDDNQLRVGERDDLSGMALNMFGKLDARSLIIIWVMFLFIHTEMFGDYILKRFSGARNEDGTMTMKGTIYASFFMILIVIICTLIF